MNSDKGQRVEYLDLIKAISIILVVFCHFTFLSNETVVGNVIMSIAWGSVPCFFMVSGGLMHVGRQFSWRKWGLRLLRTYVVLASWKVIYLLVYHFVLSPVTFSKRALVSYLFLFGTLDGVNTGVMWFMYAYFSVMLFLPISYHLFRDEKYGRKVLCYVLLLLFVFEFLFTALNFVFDWAEKAGWIDSFSISVDSVYPFGTYANMLFFFILGAFLLEYREQFLDWLGGGAWRKWIPLLLITAGTIGLFLIKWTQTGSFSWAGTYLSGGYTRISTVVLALGIYFQVMILPQNNILSFCGKYIGRNTMGIYYLHYIISAVVYGKLAGDLAQYLSLGLNIVRTVLITIVSILLIMLLRKIPLLRRMVQ